MKSWLTENRSSDARAKAPPPLQAYLWTLDPGLARRFLKETAPTPDRVRPLPPLEERRDWGVAESALVFLAAADVHALPWPEIQALRWDQGAELALLLPRCPDRLWRRLTRMGFTEVLSPPFSAAELDSLIESAARVQDPGRRLVALERRLKTKVEFSIPADLKFVIPTADLLAQLARSHGFAARVWSENLPLAVDEALTNAIEHGCRNDPKLRIQVQISIQHDVLRLRIEDPGQGFELGSLPDPRSEPGLRRPDGRGLLLISELMDRVQFEAGGSVILMYARRNAGKPGS